MANESGRQVPSSRRGFRVKALSTSEFHALLRAQGVPRDHLAFRCPACSTIQSMASLRHAGVAEDQLTSIVGFSCEGRFRANKASLAVKLRDFNLTQAQLVALSQFTISGRGCDWTLGGLFRIHALEVDGEPCFEPASPEEAQALMRAMTASAATPEPSQDPPLPRCS